MQPRDLLSSVLALTMLAPVQAVLAQDNPTGDPVVQGIYDEGMHRSQASRLAQVLMDSVGPRLTGSPANRAANDWLLRTYKSWGVDAKNEQYGTLARLGTRAEQSDAHLTTDSTSRSDHARVECSDARDRSDGGRDHPAPRG